MSWVIVIPAYQAARHIQAVLRRITALDAPELGLVVVVNDGSSDETSQRVRESGFNRCELRLIERPRNGGYGAAMKDGLDAARALDPDVVACIHADGQYGPEALPGLSSALSLGARDLIQGSRIASGTALSGGMPIYKIVGNALLNRIENHTLGLSLTDYHSGYLVYGRRALALDYHRLSNSFDFDLELIAMATARGLSVGEAPIPTHYGDEVSHLNPLSYGLRVLRVMWNYRRGRYAAA